MVNAFPRSSVRGLIERLFVERMDAILIACYVGNSIPVIGVGLLSSIWGHDVVNAVFAGTIAGFGAIAFITGWRYAPRKM